jgi:PST family polysaccharide transporter
MERRVSLTDQTIRGIAWTTAGKVCAQVYGVVVIIVLTRMLSPADFGLIGMIIVLTGFVTLFGEFGFGPALVQRKDVEERHFSSIFWLNLLAGVVLCGLVAASSPLIASFYGEPELVPLTIVISLNFLIVPLATVPRALLERALDFRALALVEIAAVFVSGTVALVMALVGFGVWSLVAQTLVAAATNVVAVLFLSSWRPRRQLDKQAIRDLLKFSANLFGFNIMNYWARQVDDLLIGRVFGAASLGFYTRAYTIMLMPLREISGVFTRVMFPVMSTIQDDTPRIRSMYLQCLSMIALLTFPLMIWLAVDADAFIRVLFGEQWLEMTMVFRIMCIVGMFQSIGTTVGWIYQAVGRTDIMFRWGLIASSLIIGSIVLGVYLGTIESVAICYGIMTVVILAYPQYTIPGRLIDLRFGQIVRTVSPILGCSTAMGLLVYVLQGNLPAALPEWAALLIRLSAAGVTYLALLRVFRVEAFQTVTAFVAERRGKESPDIAAP